MKTRHLLAFSAVAAVLLAPSVQSDEIHRYQWHTTGGAEGFSGELVLSQFAYDAKAFDIDESLATVLDFHLGTPQGDYDFSRGQNQAHLAGQSGFAPARLLKLEGELDENGALSKLLFILTIPSGTPAPPMPIRFVAREKLVEQFVSDPGSALIRTFADGQWNPLPEPRVPDTTPTLPLLLLSAVLLFVPAALSRRLRRHGRA